MSKPLREGEIWNGYWTELENGLHFHALSRPGEICPIMTYDTVIDLKDLRSAVEGLRKDLYDYHFKQQGKGLRESIPRKLAIVNHWLNCWDGTTDKEESG